MNPSSTDQQEEIGQWLLFKKQQDQYVFPHTMEKVEQLSDQVLYVRGKEADINTFESKHSDVNVYPIEGCFQFSKETLDYLYKDSRKKVLKSFNAFFHDHDRILVSACFRCCFFPFSLLAQCGQKKGAT